MLASFTACFKRFTSGPLMPAFAALQLYELDFESISILAFKTECYCIDDSGTRRSSLPLKESDTPAVFFAMRLKRGFAGSFRGAGFDETLFGSDRFPCLVCGCSLIAHGPHCIWFEGRELDSVIRSNQDENV
jgi:hypothetical protein